MFFTFFNIFINKNSAQIVLFEYFLMKICKMLAIFKL